MYYSNPLPRYDDTSSVNSSWEDDADGPAEIRIQLQHLQGMIFKKEREFQEAELKTQHTIKEQERLMEHMKGELEFAEAQRLRLQDEVAKLRAQVCNGIDPDSDEKVHKATLCLQRDFERARAHDELMRKNEMERAKRMEEAQHAEMKAREQRLHILLSDEQARNREREDALRAQIDEERLLGEERLRQREESLRVQMADEAKRTDERLQELQRIANEEKARADEKSQQARELQREMEAIKADLEREYRKKEDELREHEQQQLQRERDAAGKREQALRDQLDDLHNTNHSKILKASDTEKSLRDELAENRRDALARESALRQQLSDTSHDLDKARSELAALSDQLALEQQKLAAERDQWEAESKLDRETSQKIHSLELEKLRQELEDEYKQKLEDFKNQSAPSPPGVRRPNLSVQPRATRPQPQPPSQDSPMRRPFVGSPVPPLQQQPLTSFNGDDDRVKAMLKQIEHQKIRIDELLEELDAVKRKEEKRRLADIEDLERKIAEHRNRRGSLENAKSDIERQLRDAVMQLEEKNLLMQKAERMSADEIDELKHKLQMLKTSSADEAERLQKRINSLEEELRASRESLRNTERNLQDERNKALGDHLNSESQLRAELHALNAEVQTLRSDLARRSEELASRSVDLASAQGELTAKTSEILSLQSQLSSAQDEIQALCKNLQERDALVCAQAELSAAEEERQKETLRLFENECNQHQQQLEDLQKMLQDRQDELDNSTMEAGNVKRDVEMLRSENSRLREELAATRENLRSELEKLRDESQELERKLYVAEQEAVMQRERADDLHHILTEKGNLEEQGRKAASDAMAEAAERELDRLREQLTTKTDQLLMKDRLEEALRTKLELLLNEIDPDIPEHPSDGEETDPTALSVLKIQRGKAWIDSLLKRISALKSSLAVCESSMSQFVSNGKKVRLLKKKLARVLKRCVKLQKQYNKLKKKKRAKQIIYKTLPSESVVETVMVERPGPQQPQQSAVVRYQPSEQPNENDGERRGGRRTEVSPPPPVSGRVHFDERMSPGPAMHPSSDDRPSVEQIEQLLESMEDLINKPLPGIAATPHQLRSVSPLRERAARDMSPAPPPPVHSSIEPFPPPVPTREGSVATARVLLSVHEQNRARREFRISEITSTALRKDTEIAALKAKEATLAQHRDRTMTKIDEQQASLMSNLTYWRQQAAKHQASNQQVELAACSDKIAQCESDLLCLVRQKPEMLSKANMASAHLNSEITRLIEQKASLEKELQQLHNECSDIIEQEAVLGVAATTTTTLPTPAFLPPAVPLPMTMLG